MAAAVVFDDELTSETSGGTEDSKEQIPRTTPEQAVFNIVKNIVGEGMLSLPAGVAAGTGLGLAVVLLTLFGAVLGYTFAVMGRACHITRRDSHLDCGRELAGRGVGQLMAFVCTCKTAFTCLAYAIVIGEPYSRILHFFGFRDPLWTTRQTVLIIIMVCVLLPLVLQDLKLLSFTSAIGIACEIFVVAVMQVRYLDGSYASPAGQFYNEIAPRYHPDFDDGVQWWHTSIMTFVLFGSLSTAFIAHYNGPRFYSQLRDEHRNPRCFALVVTAAFSIAWAIYAWVMSVGYLTFGEASQGLILNNYSEEDPLATGARVAIGFAVMFGFPLAFESLRHNAFSLLGWEEDGGPVFVGFTVVLLGCIAAGGCFFSDLGLVNSLGGAIFGAAITLIFPGILAYCASRSPRVAHRKEFGRCEGRLALAVVAFGVVLLIFGSAINVIKRCFPELLPRSR